MQKYLLAAIASLVIGMAALAQVPSRTNQIMVLGTIHEVTGNTIIIENEANPHIPVDISRAKAEDHIGTPVVVGRPVVVRGHFEGEILKADSVHKGQ